MNKSLVIMSGVGLVIVLAIVGYVLLQPKNQTQNSQSATSSPKASTQTVQWQRGSTGWVANGTAPACADPIVAQSPADVSKATAVLYPGQTRGGNYKPHGGLRFDGLNNTDVTVSAPFDATVMRGTRYLEMGEVQYLFDFINSCGYMYRLDHLSVLSPAMQAIADTFPQPKENESQTHNLTTPVSVKAGDPIATAVGFQSSKNVGFDFGLYDLRHKNAASQNTAWAAQHGSEELAPYAVCWLDQLPAADKAKVKSLPGGDQVAGKTSDFCN
jgi:hypothetical protein